MMMAQSLLLAALAASSVSSRKPAEPVWNAELRVGPYAPTIATGDGRAFYDLIFGADLADSTVKGQPLLKSFALHRFFSHRYGSIGAGGSIGYWSVNGKARQCTDAAGATLDCSDPQADPMQSIPGNTDVSLSVVPITLGGIYRYDLRRLSDTVGFPVPLLLHVKASVSYNVWWSMADGEGAVKADGKTPGKGGIWGYHAAAGLAINLDSFVPPAHRRARAHSGPLSSHIFIEANLLNGNQFGTVSAPDFSDTLWVAGLSLDFD